MAAERKDGVTRIAYERQRQIEVEGWTPEHDDEHTACELTMAASAYAHYAVGQANGVEWPEDDDRHPAVGWPWHLDWWKPSDDPIPNLVKAGALIAAEIDRLQRALSVFEAEGWASTIEPDEPTHIFVGYDANPNICRFCGAVKPMPCYRIKVD